MNKGAGETTTWPCTGGAEHDGGGKGAISDAGATSVTSSSTARHTRPELRQVAGSETFRNSEDFVTSKYNKFCVVNAMIPRDTSLLDDPRSWMDDLCVFCWKLGATQYFLGTVRHAPDRDAVSPRRHH